MGSPSRTVDRELIPAGLGGVFPVEIRTPAKAAADCCIEESARHGVGTCRVHGEYIEGAIAATPAIAATGVGFAASMCGEHRGPVPSGGTHGFPAVVPGGCATLVTEGIEQR